MSECIKCNKCNNCSCSCKCVKEENKANWNFEAFQKMLESYSSPKFKKFNNEELPKRFSLILIDNNADEEWEIEYRTKINVIQVANVLMDYFGIEVDAVPKDGFDIVGFIESKFDEDEDEDN